jgi:Na+-driven multidrug efflux pump
MNTKYLMTAASIVLGVTGIALSFLSQEILAILSEQTTPTLTVMLQLLGALYFGFAMLNWMAKDSLLGGIYGRPIVAANVSHFFIGALALLKVLFQHHEIILWIVTIVYTLFAVLFSLIMYNNPKNKVTVAS